jgi:shikimate 5-dehydrogenase
MTRPRISIERKIFGIIGSIPAKSKVQSNWNTFFIEEKVDSFMDYYPTTEKNLPERLSEMFHFDRRGYIVGAKLQESIITFLDALDVSVETEGKVDTVWNDNGVLRGYFLESSKEARYNLWCKK